MFINTHGLSPQNMGGGTKKLFWGRGHWGVSLTSPNVNQKTDT